MTSNLTCCWLLRGVKMIISWKLFLIISEVIGITFISTLTLVRGFNVMVCICKWIHFGPPVCCVSFCIRQDLVDNLYLRHVLLPGCNIDLIFQYSGISLNSTFILQSIMTFLRFPCFLCEFLGKIKDWFLIPLFAVLNSVFLLSVYLENPVYLSPSWKRVQEKVIMLGCI